MMHCSTQDASMVDQWRRRRFVTALLAGGTVLAAAATTALHADEQDDDSLPDPGTLVERHVEAIGGEEAIKKHESTTLRGTVEMPGMGMNGEMTIYAAQPDRLYSEMNMPGAGEFKQGYDGDVGWMTSQMTGPMLMEEEQLQEFRRQADFYNDLNFLKHYDDITVAGRTEFENADAYHVKATLDDGEPVHYYFDAEDGFLIGRRAWQETGMGRAEATIIFEEYTEHDGVKIATVIRNKMQGMETIVNITDVEFNTVDDSVFDLPDDIQRLVERRREQNTSDDN